MDKIKSQRVVILGASSRPDRYSYKAMKLLEEYGHQVYLVNPREKEIEGHQVFAQLSDVPRPIDTLTLYLNPELLSNLRQEIISLGAKRVIFNPGTEYAELENELRAKGAETLEACTLVLLKTNQFSPG